MDISAHLRLASWLYRAAGLPIGLGSEPPSMARIAAAASCYSSYAILSAYNLYVLLSSSDTDGYGLYSKFFWTLFPLLCALATTAMALRYKSFTRMSARVEYIRELMRVRNISIGTSKVWRISAGFWAAITLSSITLSVIINAHEFLNMSEPLAGFDQMAISTGAQVLLQVPSVLFFFALLYHAGLQYLIELWVVEEVRRQLTAGVGEREEFPESPRGEEAPPSLAAEDETTGGTRTLTLARCRELLDIYCQAKRLRLEAESWLHVPLCSIMFTAAWYFPILASHYRQPDLDIYYLHVLTAYMVVGTVLKLGPICLRQLVDYRKTVLLVRVSWKVVHTQDPDLKKALLKLFASIRDKYPDSPDVLLDFDLSLLSILVDATLLMVTTFF